MGYSLVLPIHIAAGILGVLSGAAALVLRKGYRGHVLSGQVFVAAMLTLATSGVLLAIVKSQPGNVLGGSLTFYLVATAWMTAKRGEAETGILDWGALLVVLAVAAFELTFGIEAATSSTGLKYNYPPWPYFLWVPCRCWRCGVMHACWCAAELPVHSGSPGIFGACVLGSLSRQRRYFWRGNICSPRSCARQECSYC